MTPRISYAINLDDNDGRGPTVTISGDEFGKRITMSEIDFENLYAEFQTQREQAYETLMPWESKMIKQQQRTNELLKEILGNKK